MRTGQYTRNIYNSSGLSPHRCRSKQLFTSDDGDDPNNCTTRTDAVHILLLQMNRGGQPRSPEPPSRTAAASVDAMKNEEPTIQSSHQQRNMLAEAIASLPPVPQNLSAIALFHQLPILYQQHYQHMLQSRILPYLQESLRLQSSVTFADKPQMPTVSLICVLRVYITYLLILHAVYWPAHNYNIWWFNFHVNSFLSLKSGMRQTVSNPSCHELSCSPLFAL